MRNPKFKSINAFLNSVVHRTMPWLALLLLGAIAYAGDDRHDADRPDRDRGRNPFPVPLELQAPATNTLSFHATGVGVQIYVWTVNPTNAALASWVFKAPHAVLFGLHQGDEEVVGIHFAGPTWQANDGSKVVGARLASVTVNSNAIPWLLLQAANTSGDGTLTDTTYIQRLNTLGGLAPTTPGNVAGQEALVPYIADYYFYHAQH